MKLGVMQTLVMMLLSVSTSYRCASPVSLFPSADTNMRAANPKKQPPSPMMQHHQQQQRRFEPQLHDGYEQTAAQNARAPSAGIHHNRPAAVRYSPSSPVQQPSQKKLNVADIRDKFEKQQYRHPIANQVSTDMHPIYPAASTIRRPIVPPKRLPSPSGPSIPNRRLIEAPPLDDDLTEDDDDDTRQQIFEEMEQQQQHPSWHHGNIDRLEAERRLQHEANAANRSNGLYLVRTGKGTDIPYVLSLMHDDAHICYHTTVRMKKHNGQLAAGVSEKSGEPEFGSIEQLVTYYRQHDLVLKSRTDDGSTLQCRLLTAVIAPNSSSNNNNRIR